MGGSIAEIIVFVGIFAGLYLILRPLRRRIEAHLKSWLDRQKFNRPQNGPIIDVEPIRKERESKKDPS